MAREPVDLTGKIFDRLTVVSLSHYKDEKTQRYYFWNCICECGGSKIVKSIYLTRGATTSCGCRRGEDKRLDITGNRYGRLIALERAYSKNNATFWKCQCDCGVISVHRLKDLQGGNCNSCGCYQIEVTIKRSRKHGHKSKFEQGTIYGSGTYNTWRSMIKRCTLPTHQAYQWYGGRGIKVCDRWLESFENFLEDLGVRPEGWTIERIDVNGNYEKSNVRYATKQEQYWNRTDSLWIEYRGEKKCLAEWLRILKEEDLPVVNYNCARYRIYNGIPPEIAMFE